MGTSPASATATTTTITTGVTSARIAAMRRRSVVIGFPGDIPPEPTRGTASFS